MALTYRLAPANLAADYVHLRSQTRQNAIGKARLAALGVTAQSWANDIQRNHLLGFVAEQCASLAGYCFANLQTGEVVVLAVLPDFENQGVGRHLLHRVVHELWQRGWPRIFLSCSADPASRSYGFYRHLGWLGTGSVDDRGDELLELTRPLPGAASVQAPPHWPPSTALTPDDRTK